ncbi:hypothetical protein Mal64_25230 [Pseudobythopirellula maris]|uniref:Segregation and condensation protein B n=1 Tax=Pseudobythopirellula maris TaxID=2527991 RepID=A0A5C5ZNG8_9BACT|nr:SMC-Scp complex subunit ScpB [Pseudobythopirellula maris]TWT89032.1 hypothetical protein Mal64_25230 [Pseudobythopirellula maris]
MLRSVSEQAEQDPKSAAAPLSIGRLTAAFAHMLGAPSASAPDPSSGASPGSPAGADESFDGVSPRSIVEGLLFVGRDDGEPLSGARLASTMRDVSPDEVSQAVDELNARYERDGSPLTIEQTGAGYRLGLRAEHARLESRFQNRVKSARLSPESLEVLALVAYRQPITTAQIEAARGAPSASLLGRLVRRELVVGRRAEGAPAAETEYSTTDRFLRVFRMQGLGDLPRIAELSD